MLTDFPGIVAQATRSAWSWSPAAGLRPLATALLASVAVLVCLAFVRLLARRRRRYVRLRIEPHRTDEAVVEAIVRMFGALHRQLQHRWWRRLISGQPSVSLEVHREQTRGPGASSVHFVWMALTCPLGEESAVETALRTAYPNCRLTLLGGDVTIELAVLVRLKKGADFIRRVKAPDRFEHEREPPMNRLLTVIGACRGPAVVQLALVPAPVLFERYAARRFRSHENRLARERRARLIVRDRSMVDEAELRGGMELQHTPLFFADVRVLAGERRACEQIASELRVESAENRLVERGATIRHGLLCFYRQRLRRGEGNPLPGFLRGVFAPSELASLWHLPSIDYLSVPFARFATPLAPAPPAIVRPRAGEGHGTLCDAIGPVTIAPRLRRQNTAVPGTVEQGKTSYLTATVAEDLLRERCAVVVLDPKGDAADAAISLVPVSRTCTVLDFANPTCGFNPLAVDAPADVIADYVVAALKNLFSDADIRASSDRYLRNAIIAVLAFSRASTLWDAARLLSVGEDGYAYRSAVGTHVRALPEFAEISSFFTSELAAQLADARSTTTAKLDAPVNKLARLLNSASIKRVLLNDSLTVDLDRVISAGEVLVVKGALGAMGAGNTSVLMQLLIGMLDAALARQQDLVPAEERVAVALKVDEAPLVLNRGFAETMALKRSAGLETVACWQSDAQWTDREIRDQLDALFAHRVYFATASAREARSSVGLTMAEFSDTVRPGIDRLSKLGRPDSRLHLPKHHAIASWTTDEGRQPPFIARTIPLRVDRERVALHAARQRERGGHHRTDLRQPHWQRARPSEGEPEQPDAEFETGVSSTARPPARSAVAGQSQVKTLPETPAPSYRELVELDLAHGVRWARRAASPLPFEPDRRDIELLELVARLSHVLSSQLHRWLSPDRAITTTQRRLKRLADAGLLERFQFHRRDGGGVPMCYVIAPSGWALLGADNRPGAGAERAGLAADRRDALRRREASRSHATDLQRLRQARHDVHVAGWVMALVRRAGEPDAVLRGAHESVLEPPSRPTSSGRGTLSPAELRLPGGRVPHDFTRTGGAGAPIELDRFETVRPDAVVELPRAGIDLIVELDDRLPQGAGAAKLERYDHFLAGWAAHTRRYGERLQVKPVVVFICRDRRRARRCAQLADAALRACRAYAGEYPFDWEYPGRAGVLFVAERDLHEGSTHACGVPRLPPAVRVVEAHGDPHAAESLVEEREIFG
ncbi:MAG TPA: replication-relaxation family protein [Solirubrobacteraceae bacterium]|nr:replication-relaxation family protein [Solirubrobacteraceae bacterium]